MTHFLRDILRQPEELRRTLEHLAVPAAAGRGALDAATAAIRGARHVYLTGIGSSWHAALNVSVLFHQHAYPVYLQDAAELLIFATFPKDSAMIIISRSGKSSEIVQLAAKARQAGVTVIGITNAPEGTLAKEAHTAIVVPIAFDHAISVNTYATLAAATGLLASSVVATPGQNGKKKADSSGSGYGGPQPEGRNDKSGVFRREAELVASLTRAVAEAGRAIPEWQEQIARSAWLAARSTTYFLARGSSL